MITFLCLLVAAPVVTPKPFEPLKVLVLDLRADGVSEATAGVVRDEVTVRLGRDDRLEVLSAEDLRRSMNVEAQKQAMGCADDSCLAEIGAAFGARYIVHGSIGVLGDSTVVHVNLFDTERNRAVARETAEARSQNELLDAVRAALDRLLARVDAPHPAAALADTTPMRPLSTLAMVGAALGGLGILGAVAGGIGIVASLATVDDKTRSGADRQSAQRVGAVCTIVEVASVLALGGGAVIVAVGVME